jgi:hypothetical protein
MLTTELRSYAGLQIGDGCNVPVGTVSPFVSHLVYKSLVLADSVRHRLLSKSLCLACRTVPHILLFTCSPVPRYLHNTT